MECKVVGCVIFDDERCIGTDAIFYFFLHIEKMLDIDFKGFFHV